MSFTDAVKFTLDREGGFVNHPADKGGKTNRGITEATLNTAKKQNLLPDSVTIENLTAEQASLIYKANYWNAKNLRMDEIDRISPAIAAAVFDIAVNSGPDTAGRLLQSTLSVNVDGIVGPVTLNAIHNQWEGLAERLLWTRLNYYYYLIETNQSQAVFAKGWRNRLKAFAKEYGIYWRCYK